MSLLDGLVAYWKFDEGTGTSAADATGNGNTGTLINATWATGKINGGISAPNTTNAVSVGTGLSLAAGGEISIAGWANPSSISGFDEIIGKRDGSGYEWQFRLNSGKLSLLLNGGGSKDSTLTLSSGAWQFVGVRRASDGTVKFFLGGSSNAPGSIASWTANTSRGVYIGGGPDGNNFDGSIDEIGVWSRALTDAEFSSLYNSAAGLSYDSFGGGGGSVTASGDIDATPPTLSGSGVVSISGSGGVSATVPALSGSGTVGSAVDGSGAINATVPTLAASGKVQIDASGGVQSTVPALSGSATVSIAGSGGVNATVPTISGTGAHAIPASGGVNATVPALDGTGVISIAGSGGVLAGVPALDGTGDVEGGAVTGSGAISATVIRLHGDGTVVGGASRGDDGGPRWAPRHVRPIRVIYDEEDIREVLGEPTAKAVKPTKAKKRKLVQNVEQKVLSAASLPAVFAPVVERAISQEIGTSWKGPSDWEVLSAILNVAAEKAAEEIHRIQAEIEEEDEMILLLAA